jgi:hypothetical protein
MNTCHSWGQVVDIGEKNEALTLSWGATGQAITWGFPKSCHKKESDQPLGEGLIGH